jgi:hypothetical protein
LHAAHHVRACFAAILLLVPSLAIAQETREAEITAAQREKAERLHTHKPNRAEDLLLTMRKTLIEHPSGFYPYFDSVYSGGGFTLGSGYRRFTGDKTHWSVAGLYSGKGYKLIEGSLVSPGHWSERIDLKAAAGWRDATRVSYHGLGVDSPADANTAYRMQQGYAGGNVTVRPYRFLLLTADATVEDYTLKDPTGERDPIDPADQAFAPGAGTNPQFLHTTTSAAWDWRPASDYARRGGLYRIARHHYADRDGTYSFDRLDAEIVQHVPVLRENWVLSFRGRLQTTLGAGDVVPFFMMPSLGSGSTLRGYGSWRFRDRHATLANAEWRWIANRLALDMALFFDAGMVAPTLDGVALRSFVSNYGIGARFHGPVRTPLRIELARGSEGTQIVFAASAVF